MTKAEIKELYKVMFADYPDIVNITQLQKMLCIGEHAAYNLIKDGKIPTLKIGNAFRIAKVSVIDYALQNT